MAAAVCRDRGIRVVGQQQQERELLVSPGRQRALRRKHADVARHLAAAKEVDQRGTDAGVHQRGGGRAGVPLAGGAAGLTMFAPAASAGVDVLGTVAKDEIHDDRRR